MSRLLLGLVIREEEDLDYGAGVVSDVRAEAAGRKRGIGSGLGQIDEGDRDPVLGQALVGELGDRLAGGLRRDLVELLRGVERRDLAGGDGKGERRSGREGEKKERRGPLQERAPGAPGIQAVAMGADARKAASASRRAR